MPSLLDDKDAIRELIHLYSHYADSDDRDKWVSLFVKDCVWDGGPFGRYEGHDGLLAMYNKGKAPNRRHFINNTVVHVEGDSARSVSYVALIEFTKPSYTLLGGGFYLDQFVRRDRRWRFKQRKFRSQLTPADTLPIRDTA